MNYPKLIILYGYHSTTEVIKNENLINETLTCGYREYASKFGEIIYVSPQKNLKYAWEKSIYNLNELINYCSKFPNAIIWSVKHCPFKDEILKKLKWHKKVYYSCCAKNTFNEFADISLVDTESRITHKNHRLHIKGKDYNFWSPNLITDKYFDYVLMGTRDDKNQSYFINNLLKNNDSKKILWIGGKEFKRKVNYKNVTCTPVVGPAKISQLIPMAKFGVLYTEISTEGFPQSFLEMTMSGVPVIYGGPINNIYFSKYNSIIVHKKKNLIKVALNAINNYSIYNIDICRKYAIKHYSLQKSYENILNHLGVKYE